MNKRQRKKYEKKLCHKTYYGYKKAKKKKDTEDFILKNVSVFDKTMRALLATAYPDREDEIIHSDYMGQECTDKDVQDVKLMIARMNAINKNCNIFGVPSELMLGPRHSGPLYGLRSTNQIIDEFPMDDHKEANKVIYATTDPAGKEVTSASEMDIVNIFLGL